MSAQEKFSWHSPGINFFSLQKLYRFLHEHFPYFYYFLDPTYVGVWTENMLCVYLHQHGKCIMKTSRVLVISNKRMVLKYM